MQNITVDRLNEVNTNKLKKTRPQKTKKAGGLGKRGGW